MPPRGAPIRIASVAVAVLLAIPLGLLIGGAAAGPAHPPAAAHSDSGAVAGSGLQGPAAVAARDERTLAARHVPARDVFWPNLNPSLSESGDVIRSTYDIAPAPMGIGDDGVQSVGGRAVGTVSYTSSAEAIVHLDSVNDTYVDGDGADSISIQLNTVLTHVDLFGNTSYQFWIQNVPTYTPFDHGFTIVDNIWNFSNGAFDFTPNSLYSYDGYEIAPVYYFANGPVFHLPEPFTVRLYNNASVVNDRPTVFFNYSITAANGTVYSGSYDRVEFNSTGLVPPKHAAPSPTFQIDGQHYGANGYLPNDAEITIGGWDDGSTQTFSQINATMQLLTEANGTGTYTTVPAAFNHGFDTGETAEGIAEWASPGVAHLGPGPSIVGPLWGLPGATYGHEDLDVHVRPSNAFLFVSPGASFKAGDAAWAPLTTTGAEQIQLPVGSYALKALLSDYRPAAAAVGAGNVSLTFGLVADSRLGVYTPLWAWGNGQLAAISEAGNGTIGNPYVLDNRPATINPLFGEFNDFVFPVFPGIFLAHTTAYVEVASPPPFQVAYSLPYERQSVALFGLPSVNDLQIQTMNTSHVTIAGALVLSGWYFSEDYGEPLASVVVWNSTDTLVAGNAFQDQGFGLLVFGGGHNTVWGNTFNVSIPATANPSAILNGSDQVGIILYGSKDLVYNNYFDVPIGATTPPIDITTFLPAVYVDTWNITPQPATNAHTFNGIPLRGSILGLSWQGGNYWSNYGTTANPYGVLPYNDSGQITVGGDEAPLINVTLYSVTLREKGLPAGAEWSATLGGVTLSTNGTSIVFWVTNGTYAYTVPAAGHHRATPSIGAVRINGSNASVGIRFS